MDNNSCNMIITSSGTNTMSSLETNYKCLQQVISRGNEQKTHLQFNHTESFI